MKIIKLDNVSKYYKSTETVSVGMKNVSLSFDIGEFVAVTGESGSGKSTLLNVISGLDGYEDGEVYHYGEETSHFQVSDWERFRSAYIGFVFQNYNIIDSYTVYQNVLLALEVQGYPSRLRKKRAYELIEKVGLTSHRHHKASKLSGGQKQRAVIARALAKDCPIIVADEPTGNLDSVSAKQIMELLNEISEDKLVIVVTHDYDQVKGYATRKIKMHDGEVVEDVSVGPYTEKDEIIKPEIKRMSIFSLIRMAFRNLTSTPRRSIFMLFMQILVIGVLTVVYTSQIRNIREAGLAQSNLFPNVPETRVLLEKRDGSKFTINEITNFRNNNSVLEVYENSKLFYNESRLYLRKQNDIYGRYYIDKTDSAIILKSNEIKGSMPVEIDEIVVSSMWNYFNIGDVVDIVGSAMYFNGDEKEEDVTPYYGTFKITGIDKQDRQTIYFSDKYLKQNDLELEVINYDRYYNTKNALQYQLRINLGGKEIYVYRRGIDDNKEYDLYTDGDIDEIYDNIDLNFKTYSSTGIILEKTIKGLSLGIASKSYETYISLGMKKEIFDELIDEFMEIVEHEYIIPNRNLLILEVSSYYMGNKLIKTLDNTNYKIYYPANINSPMRDIMVFLQTFLAVILLTLLGLLLYSIVHSVTKNVMANRKKDFAIYRSIGTNQSALAKLVVLEQVILNTIGFVITITLMNLLKDQFSVLQKSIPYMEFRDYVILIVVFVMFGIWLGLRFNKKVFNQSVIETLTLSKGDF